MKVVIIDDDPTFRALVALLVQQRHAPVRVFEAESAAQARALCARERPDLALVDRQLGVDDGVALGMALRRESPGLKMLLMTAYPAEDLPARLLAAGFLGYIDKDAKIERIVQAVEAVAAGQFFFASKVPPALTSEEAPGMKVNRAELERLAPRQREIAALVARGRMSKEIAADLNLSLRTVEKHRSAILRRLGLRDTASLTLWCLRAGLIS